MQISPTAEQQSPAASGPLTAEPPTFADFALDQPRSFPIPQPLQAALQEACDRARSELLHQLREMEMTLAARSDAVVLAAPSSRTHVRFDRSSYRNDWAFDVKRGGVEISLSYHRDPDRGPTGRPYHRGNCWSGSERRKDVFGSEWTRHLGGYLVMDDFGDLVEAPEC